MRWNIPNILTFLRLVAAPGIALAFVAFDRPVADWVALILFISAALTDYFDGYLARRWNQISKFGRMLDPIADKAMVVIALAVLMGLSGLDPLILIPASLILFREVMVSGLREFLGADSGRLKVTPLAKWKTTLQMTAIPLMFLTGILEWDYIRAGHQLDPWLIEEIFAGRAADEFGLVAAAERYQVSVWAGIIMIWLAAFLTVVTGWDYFRKAMPFLADTKV